MEGGQGGEAGMEEEEGRGKEAGKDERVESRRGCWEAEETRQKYVAEGGPLRSTLPSFPPSAL